MGFLKVHAKVTQLTHFSYDMKLYVKDGIFFKEDSVIVLLLIIKEPKYDLID